MKINTPYKVSKLIDITGTAIELRHQAELINIALKNQNISSHKEFDSIIKNTINLISKKLILLQEKLVNQPEGQKLNEEIYSNIVEINTFATLLLWITDQNHQYIEKIQAERIVSIFNNIVDKSEGILNILSQEAE